jgi:hypothetical protein
MKTIGALAENIQQQVDFTGRLFFQLNHAGLTVNQLIGNRNAPAKPGTGQEERVP